MVSWTYAFKRGAIIWLWTIVWGIIGAIVAVAISGGSILAIVTNPNAFTTTSSIVTAAAGIFLGALIGALITSIGSFATIVKIVLDSKQQTAT